MPFGQMSSCSEMSAVGVAGKRKPVSGCTKQGLLLPASCNKACQLLHVLGIAVETVDDEAFRAARRQGLVEALVPLSKGEGPAQSGSRIPELVRKPRWAIEALLRLGGDEAQRLCRVLSGVLQRH